MAKLSFNYGEMGSSKTAHLLITQFNYLERGMSVWLLKPALDISDGKTIIRFRRGFGRQGLLFGNVLQVLAPKN